MGRLATEPRPPRPADLAIAGSRMLTGLLRRIWKLNYSQLAPGNMGTSLTLMMLMFRIMVATSDGEPLTITELANAVSMPPATVKRYVDVLVKHLRAKMVAQRKRGRGQQQVIVANLDYLDSKMTLDHWDKSIETIETCLNELIRLRLLLHDQLVRNGRHAKAAE